MNGQLLVTWLVVGAWAGCATTGGERAAPQPVETTGPPANAAPVTPLLAIGGDFWCAYRERSDLRCWGGNAHGQLGIGVVTRSEDIPRPVLGLPRGYDVRKLVAAGKSVCALLAGGSVWCWGEKERATVQATPRRLLVADVVDLTFEYELCVVRVTGEARATSCLDRGWERWTLREAEDGEEADEGDEGDEEGEVGQFTSERERALRADGFDPADARRFAGDHFVCVLGADPISPVDCRSRYTAARRLLPWAPPRVAWKQELAQLEKLRRMRREAERDLVAAAAYLALRAPTWTTDRATIKVMTGDADGLWRVTQGQIERIARAVPSPSRPECDVVLRLLERALTAKGGDMTPPEATNPVIAACEKAWTTAQAKRALRLIGVARYAKRQGGFLLPLARLRARAGEPVAEITAWLRDRLSKSSVTDQAAGLLAWARWLHDDGRGADAAAVARWLGSLTIPDDARTQGDFYREGKTVIDPFRWATARERLLREHHPEEAARLLRTAEALAEQFLRKKDRVTAAYGLVVVASAHLKAGRRAKAEALASRADALLAAADKQRSARMWQWDGHDPNEELLRLHLDLEHWAVVAKRAGTGDLAVLVMNARETPSGRKFLQTRDPVLWKRRQAFGTGGCKLGIRQWPRRLGYPYVLARDCRDRLEEAARAALGSGAHTRAALHFAYAGRYRESLQALTEVTAAVDRTHVLESLAITWLMAGRPAVEGLKDLLPPVLPPIPTPHAAARAE